MQGRASDNSVRNRRRVRAGADAAEPQRRKGRALKSRTEARSNVPSMAGLVVTSGTGWADVSALFQTVASWFSDLTEFNFEVVAAGASGDLAYTVGYEHNRVKVEGQPRTYSLRVTHVYRREDGQWRIVHRHGDIPPAGDHPIAATPPAAAGGSSSR